MATEGDDVSRRKPILCLDFDGVIHSYTSGWQGADTIRDDIVPGTLEFIYDALAHYRVAVYSSRSSSMAGVDAMKAFIQKHAREKVWDSGREWWLEIEWPPNKPAAFLTIDDRAITFNGTWPTLAEIGQFQPWTAKVSKREAAE